MRGREKERGESEREGERDRKRKRERNALGECETGSIDVGPHFGTPLHHVVLGILKGT